MSDKDFEDISIFQKFNPVIFREYFGVKPDTKPFEIPSDIVNSREIEEFHFILGFAHETYGEDGKGTGNFNASWNLDFFDKQRVKGIKDNHPNVKVYISIGGHDDGDTKYPFSPIGKVYWCYNAVESLKKIIQLYNGSDASCCHNLIDGIDINYEHINTDDVQDFSNYVGDVITGLKKEVGIDVVSIAPSHETHKHYKALYLACTDNIKWVSYQFYLQTLPTKDEFVNLFGSLSKEYAPKKLLVGASTDPRDAGNLSHDVFLQGCTDLVKNKSLSGIFIWNANHSTSTPAHSEGGLSFLEKIAAAFSFSMDLHFHFEI